MLSLSWHAATPHPLRSLLILFVFIIIVMIFVLLLLLQNNDWLYAIKYDEIAIKSIDSLPQLWRMRANEQKVASMSPCTQTPPLFWLATAATVNNTLYYVCLCCDGRALPPTPQLATYNSLHEHRQSICKHFYWFYRVTKTENQQFLFFTWNNNCCASRCHKHSV